MKTNTLKRTIDLSLTISKETLQAIIDSLPDGDVELSFRLSHTIWDGYAIHTINPAPFGTEYRYIGTAYPLKLQQ